MCNVCAFNVNGCGCNRSLNNGCGGWLSNLFNGGNSCQTTYNRCGCQTTYNRCGCQTTYNCCQRNYACVTICGNFSPSPVTTTSCQDAYYSRLYGVNTTGRSGCGCSSGYNFEQTD